MEHKNNIKAIVNSLQSVFAPFDVEVLQDSKQWAKGRVSSIHAFMQSEEAKTLRRDVWSYYERLHQIAGGKAWFSLFRGRNAEMIEEMIEKNCKQSADKRNASIAKKLEKAGVIDVISEEFIMSQDGFDGLFVVNTDKGRKTVSVNTVKAGGHTVQCLHLRVLVKVK